MNDFETEVFPSILRHKTMVFQSIWWEMLKLKLEGAYLLAKH